LRGCSKNYPPYVNYLVGLLGSQKDPRVVKLIAALQSPAAKEFIEEKYRRAVIPAF
jgi:D-methionine transport system substrate-binding protein